MDFGGGNVVSCVVDVVFVIGLRCVVVEDILV